MPGAPSSPRDDPADGVAAPGEVPAAGVTVTAPPVVVVLVTCDPGDWLEAALTGLSVQDYPDLTVLVLDAGCAEDPTSRVAAVLPRAFVRRVDGEPTFAETANEALQVVEGAAFLVFCHDDVVWEPDAVRLMLEEAYRSNAGVVGAKLVEATNPRVLLEVGLAIDRFGAPHSDIEPGELDQEQHDAVRDVFYVSSTAMLIRFDLFAELEGFDPKVSPGGEDLDLCWRARLAGARVLIAPDARATHRHVERPRGVDQLPTPHETERARLRSLLVGYSRRSLVYLVPWAALHGFIEIVAFVVTRRFERARAVVAAWPWNLRRLGSVRRARARAQRLRRVPDRDLRALQIRGSARARQFIDRRLKTDETVEFLGTQGRAVAARAQTGARQPIYLALAFLALVFVVGSRGLWRDGVPQIGQFAAWPGVTDLLSSFASGWRETMLGSPTPAPAVLGLMGLVSLPVFGATGLVWTVVVLACMPIGALGAGKLVRAVSAGSLPAIAAGIAYALLPVWRNAIANGRIGPLILLALAPFFVGLVLRAVGSDRAGGVGKAKWARHLLGLGALGALLTAWYPPALLLGLCVAAALALSAPLVGGLVLAGRVLIGTAIAGVGAAVLLFPWPLGVLLGGPDPGSVGFAFRPSLDLGEVLRMSSGPAGSRWSAGGVLVGALLVLLIGTGPRMIWGIRAWALALVGFLLTWMPARFATEVPIVAPEATLVVFALGVAVAVGLGVAAFIEDLRGHHFGWRQAVSVGAFAAIGLSSIGIVGDAVTGRWHAPDRDWPTALAFAEPDELGPARVLWVGDATVLPFDAAMADHETGYVLTRDGAGDATDTLRAPQTEADELVGEALDLATERRTDRLGHLLAPMGIRYLVVPERVGPRAGTRTAPPEELVAGLDSQLDLAKVVETEDEIRVYENVAWFPTSAIVDGEPPSGDDPLDLAARSEHGGAPVAEGEIGPGTVLWSQASNAGWQAHARGDRLTRIETFGWANGFELDQPATVEITWARQWQRNLTVIVQAAIILGAVAWGWRRTRRPASEHRRGLSEAPR